MASFLSSAQKKVTDVRGFLRDAASANTIKYVAEKGAKHIIYFPYKDVVEADESGNQVTHKEIVAISGKVHEWQSPDGKYKAVVCMKDVVRNAEDGSVLNDGSCPFCDRVTDAWDIYRYRKELEDASCALQGEDRKKHMEKTLATYADERKAKDARDYMYILVVKFRASADGNIVMGSDGMPEYDLKVMKLSQSRVDKIQQQISNAGTELPGAELMFEYPNTDDRRLQVSQSTTSPVFPTNQMTVRYPALRAKIDADVAKFEWDSGMEKSFPEWNGMTVAEAKKVTDSLFEKWDAYKNEVALNPGAKYMEYVTNTPVSNPQIAGAAPAVPTAAIPSAPGAAPAVPNVPGVPGVPGVIPNIDPNTMFGGTDGGIRI